MKFVLASYGSRGDVEPCIAFSRELLRRGHEVHMAVPPDMIGFVESAGVAAVAYGLPTRPWQDVHRELSTRFFRHLWKDRDLIRLMREDWNLFTKSWGQMSSTLTSLAKGADLLLTGILAEDAAANVAEYYDIPLATLHFAPLRANGQSLRFLPAAFGRSIGTASEWVSWRLTKRLEDAQRREQGLPKATCPAPRRMIERGSLEIQAYDEICFPGLATEWAKLNGQRPFVGPLTTELPADADDEVIWWINAGTPPIYFGFGSIPVDSPGDTLAMISAACAELGERALVCCGWTDFSHVAHFEHVKVVDSVNHAVILPACRAVVHHGGAGTTAAGLRAGVPTLILSTWVEQALWGASVRRLKVGTARRISSTTLDSLVADLRTILAPQCVAQAREVAAQMTKPAESVAAAADLVESLARQRRIG
jgi:UDP:flavonoid glycosyltransferase YjiC (YdhE family)